MYSIIDSLIQEVDDYHADAFVGKAYCAGIKSNEVCCELTDEIFGVQWNLSKGSPFSHKHFEEDIFHCDLLILVADTADKNELEQCYLMAKVGHSKGIVVLVFSLMNIILTGNRGCTSFKQQSYLMKVANVFNLDGVNRASYLFSDSGYKTVTTDLIWKLRAITEPVSRQEIIGVDYSDVRTSLSKKGQCQAFIGYGQGENKINDAITRVKESLSTKFIKAASGILITLFIGSDISPDDFDAIHNEFGREDVDYFDVMVVIGVAFNPEFLGEIGISIVVA